MMENPGIVPTTRPDISIRRYIPWYISAPAPKAERTCKKGPKEEA